MHFIIYHTFLKWRYHITNLRSFLFQVSKRLSSLDFKGEDVISLGEFFLCIN